LLSALTSPRPGAIGSALQSESSGPTTPPLPSRRRYRPKSRTITTNGSRTMRCIIFQGDADGTPRSLLGLGGSATCVTTAKKPHRRLPTSKSKILHAPGWDDPTGVVKSAHDCSDGGSPLPGGNLHHELIAPETPRLLGATIDLSRPPAARLAGSLRSAKSRGHQL